MTRGTILLVGPRKREYDLFLERLQKEGFTVERKKSQVEISKWLKDEWPQAVLFSAECPTKTVSDVMRVIQQKKQKLPFVVLGLDEAPEAVVSLKGIAEVFLLHSLAVSHALRRLVLGIQLCQIRPEDYS